MKASASPLILLVTFLFFGAFLHAQNDLQSTTKVFGEEARSAPSPTCLLRGTVFDEIDDRPIVGVMLYVEGGQHKVLTDNFGRFLLPIPSGSHSLVLSFFTDTLRQEIEIYRDAFWEVEIDLRGLQTETVVIEARSPGSNLNQVYGGIEQISIEEMKLRPSFMGELDVIGSLLTLPGVSSVGEGSSGFNVRGGRVDQNLILQNGSLILNPNHLLGFFSSFHPDAVSDFRLYKGQMPIQFGGRGASALEVNLRRGDMTTHRLKAGIGLTASRIAVEGPIVKEKASFLVAGRLAYPNYLLPVARAVDVRSSSANFGDLTAVLHYKINPSNSLELNLYGSDDRIVFADIFAYDYQTQTANLRWRSIWGTKASSTFLVGYGRYTSQLERPDPFFPEGFRNGMDYYQFKENILWSISSRHQIQAGWEAIAYLTQEEEILDLNLASDATPLLSQEKDQGIENAFYLRDRWKANEKTTITAGLRWSQFFQFNRDTTFTYPADEQPSIDNRQDTLISSLNSIGETFQGWSPRVALQYKWNKRTSLRASIQQVWQYVHQLSNTAAPTPVDIWQVSNAFVDPLRVRQVSVGISRNFNQNKWESDLDVYYKWLQNQLDYKDFAELIANPTLETEIVAAQGKSYGTEISLKKRKGRFQGSFSYTWSRTLLKADGPEKINDGEWFAANWDQPHMVQVNFQQKLGRRGINAFGLNGIFRQGRPFTALVSSYELSNGNISVPHFSNRNEFRIPNYIRVDVSLSFGKIVKRWNDQLIFSIYNVLGRENAYTIYYLRPERVFVPRPFKLSILGAAFPSVTYNIEL